MNVRLVAAPASAPAGVDHDEHYDQNGDGDRCADPERLARERHVDFPLSYGSTSPGSDRFRQLQPRVRSADGMAVWALIPLSGFALGLALARWWLVAIAVPFGAYLLATNELEANIGAWVALVLSTLLACAIACGVALRRLLRRA